MSTTPRIETWPPAATAAAVAILTEAADRQLGQREVPVPDLIGAVHPHDVIRALGALGAELLTVDDVGTDGRREWLRRVGRSAAERVAGR